MPAEVGIKLTAQDNTKRAFDAADKSLKDLDNRTDEVGKSANAAAARVDNFADEAKEAAIGVTNLGRQIFKTSAEAKKFNGVFQDAKGRLREASGEYAKSKEQIKQLGDEFKRTNDKQRGFPPAINTATKGLGGFTSSLGKARGALAALAAVGVGTQLVQFARSSFDAAVQVENLQNAFTGLGATAGEAAQEVKDLQELSLLPGISFESATKGAIQLKVVQVEGERAHSTIREFGNALAFVGEADLSGALRGLTQIISQGKVLQEDLNQITERSGLFARGLNNAFGTLKAEEIQKQLEDTGKGVQDFVDIFVGSLSELGRVPVDSTTNVLTNLGNAVKLLQVEIGEQFKDTVKDAAIALTEFLDSIRTEGLDALPAPLRRVVEGVQSLVEALRSFGGFFERQVAPVLSEYVAGLGNLLGSVLKLAGALVQVLSPALKGLQILIAVQVKAIADLLNTVSAFVNGIADAIQWIVNFGKEEGRATDETKRLTSAQLELRKAIDATTDATLRASAGTSGAVDEGNRQRDILKQLIRERDGFLKSLENEEANFKKLTASLAAYNEQGISTPAFIAEGLDRSSNSIEKLRGQIGSLNNDIRESSERVGINTATLSENASEVERLTAKEKDLQVQLANANRQLAVHEENFKKAGGAASTHGVAIGKSVDREKENISALTLAIQQTKLSREELEKKAASQDKSTTATGKSTTATKSNTTATKENETAVRALASVYQEVERAVGDASTEHAALATILAGGNVFWQQAAMGVDAFRTALEGARPHLDGTANGLEHLSGVITSNLNAQQDFISTGEDLNSVLQNLDRHLIITADDINLVNPALRDASQSVRTYTQNMNDLTTVYRSVSDISSDVTHAVREQGRAFADLRTEVGATEPTLDIFDNFEARVAGTASGMDILAENTEAFGDIAIAAFSQAAQLMREFGGEVDTVGESLLSVGDLVARIAAGDLTAVAEAPGRVLGILSDQDAAQQERSDARREDTLDTRSRQAFVFNALEGLFRSAGVDVERFAPGEGPHTEQGQITPFNFEGTSAEDFTNLIFGNNFGVDARESLAGVIDSLGLGLSDAIKNSIVSLILSGEPITPAQLEEAFQPTINTLKTDLTNATTNLSNAIDAGASTEVLEGLRETAVSAHEILADVERRREDIIESVTGLDRGDERSRLLDEQNARRNIINEAGVVTLDIDPVVDEIKTTGVESAEAIREQALQSAEEQARLAENIADRAEFNLGSATDESDFENRRAGLRQATIAYYDLELERINQLQASDAELQDLREDNALKRERELQRIDNLDNQFAQERIRREQEVASEQERAANEALDNARRQEQAQLNLAENAVQASELRLGSATDESDFESRRADLRQATIAYYDLELERINRTQASEAELQDLREDNARNREQALTRIDNLDNTFATARMRRLQDEARATEETTRRQEQAQLNLAENAVQRAEVDLGDATGVDDFEARREALRRETIAYYDLELAQINKLNLSESELQDLREDNALERAESLRRIDNIENTFAEAERRRQAELAEQAERNAAEREEASKRRHAEALRQAEEQARKQEETQRRVANLDVERAGFELEGATDEADFENRRGDLRQATIAYYDLELAQINRTQASEEELQYLRDNNALERERALTRIDNLDNEFAEARIRREQEVREEQQRAEQAREQSLLNLAENDVQRADFILSAATDEVDFENRRADLRQATIAYYDLELEQINRTQASESELQDLREDNALRREQSLRRINGLENQFAQERIRREQEAAQAAEEAAREQERQAQREAQTRVNLAQNVIQRGEFNLRAATDEADFENRRAGLRQATIAYYDLELERINGLNLSETELQDLREDNALKREQALIRIDDLENQFAQERIRREQEVAREQERIIAQSARRRERRQNIRTGSARDRQDLDIQFQRDIEDLLRGFGVTAPVERLALDTITDRGGFTREDFDRLVADSGFVNEDDFGPYNRRGSLNRIFSEIQDLLLLRGRNLEDIGLEEFRQIRDLEAEEEAERASAEAQEQAGDTVIDTATFQTADAQITTMDALLTATDANITSPNIVLQGADISLFGSAITKLDSAADKLGVAADGQQVAADALRVAAGAVSAAARQVNSASAPVRVDAVSIGNELINAQNNGTFIGFGGQ